MTTAEVSTAAREKANGIFIPLDRPTSVTDQVAVQSFIDGAVWGAAYVTPIREQIAEVLRRHNFDELLLGNIEWDGYTAVCACGWSSEEYKMPGEAHEAHSEHSAANLLTLIWEKISRAASGSH